MRQAGHAAGKAMRETVLPQAQGERELPALHRSLLTARRPPLPLAATAHSPTHPTHTHPLPTPADKVEAALQERARLQYTAQVVAEAAHSTRTVVQRLRLALAAGGVARGVARGLSLVGRRDGGGNGAGGLRDDYT